MSILHTEFLKVLGTHIQHCTLIVSERVNTFNESTGMIAFQACDYIKNILCRGKHFICAFNTLFIAVCISNTIKFHINIVEEGLKTDKT